MECGKNLVLLLLGLSALAAVVTEASPLPFDDPESSFISETEIEEVETQIERADQIESLLQRKGISSKLLKWLNRAPAKYAKQYKARNKSAKKAVKRFQKYAKRAFAIGKKVIAMRNRLRKALRIKKRDYLKTKRAARRFTRAMKKAHKALSKARHENAKKMKDFLRGRKGIRRVSRKVHVLKWKARKDRMNDHYDKKLFNGDAKKALKSSQTVQQDKKLVRQAERKKRNIMRLTRMKARSVQKKIDKALRARRKENNSKVQRLTSFLKHKVSRRERKWLRKNVKKAKKANKAKKAKNVKKAKKAKKTKKANKAKKAKKTKKAKKAKKANKAKKAKKAKKANKAKNVKKAKKAQAFMLFTMDEIVPERE